MTIIVSDAKVFIEVAVFLIIVIELRGKKKWIKKLKKFLKKIS